jgi:hypothetical protein
MRTESVKMTPEILNIIHAVLDYKHFIISENRVMKKDDFDWYESTFKYFISLPLPEGMCGNKMSFERVLSYEFKCATDLLNKLDNTEQNMLDEYYWSF